MKYCESGPDINMLTLAFFIFSQHLGRMLMRARSWHSPKAERMDSSGESSRRPAQFLLPRQLRRHGLRHLSMPPRRRLRARPSTGGSGGFSNNAKPINLPASLPNGMTEADTACLTPDERIALQYIANLYALRDRARDLHEVQSAGFIDSFGGYRLSSYCADADTSRFCGVYKNVSITDYISVLLM